MPKFLATCVSKGDMKVMPFYAGLSSLEIAERFQKLNPSTIVLDKFYYVDVADLQHNLPIIAETKEEALYILNTQNPQLRVVEII